MGYQSAVSLPAYHLSSALIASLSPLLRSHCQPVATILRPSAATQRPPLPLNSGRSSSSEVDGGDAIFITGPIVLCGRGTTEAAAGAANADRRGFAGRISQLMVFDSALSGGDVQEVWRSTRGDSSGLLTTENIPLPSEPCEGDVRWAMGSGVSSV